MLHVYAYFPSRRGTLHQVAKRLRSGELWKASKALCRAGDQPDSVDRVTFMTTGREGEFRAAYVIEFTHRKLG